jgi:hypothetical protein
VVLDDHEDGFNIHKIDLDDDHTGQEFRTAVVRASCRNLRSSVWRSQR